ncbi:hypothetical protein [Aquimarina sp. 2201CG5-10]|uniref:hypothetical protein n=1 Tax=Aquimarina callyspongiae TaxID=3098150 RepID=UPI002AB36EC3|nr:hypothetical protein [Aquimarina sp. 2201CG5-10]MDY8135916.1 hypothetical protein [Aquimarina sp. 2201CG5-10]
MQAENLRIIYNNKRRYDVTDVPQEYTMVKPINKIQKWSKKLFSELEEWGSAAGTAIRN